MPPIHRFYYNAPLASGQCFDLQGSEADHLIRVLRMGVGENVRIFTNQSAEFEATILEVSKNGVKLKVLEERKVGQNPWHISLVQAIPKSQRMDWIVEKATELGVNEIYPVITERVIKKAERIDRWQKIALAASKQCSRSELPVIHSVCSWEDFLREEHLFDLAMIATLSMGATKTIHEAIEQAASLKKIALAIGPEGDFTSSEIHQALGKKWLPVDLGPLVLRVETASIAGLSILQHELRKRGPCFH